MTTEELLKEGFIEFIEGGLDQEKKRRFRLAVTAYFKAITQLCDLLILRKRGFPPKNHSERFRLLEKDFPEVYSSVDSVFASYQETYSSELTKDSCSLLKNETKKIIHLGKFDEEFKEIVSRI
ncbi:MAG: hypothetical protein V1837_01760 [Candidatus Woesearchaeota archaeon]